MGTPYSFVRTTSVVVVLLIGVGALLAAEAVYAQDLAWAKRAGSFAFDSAFDIAVDAFGNSYVTGDFENSSLFGEGEAQETVLTSAGSLDLFLVKYSTDGTLRWAKRAGGTGGDQGNALTVSASGDIYLLGAFSASATFGPGEANEAVLTSLGSVSNLYVAKYNPDGVLQWVKQAGGEESNDHAGDIAVDAMGSSYVTGYFNESTTFGAGEANEATLTSAGSLDIFVVRYDANGQIHWSRQIGGTGVDLALGLALDASGNSYVTGYFEETVTLGAGEANETVLTSVGARDLFIAQYDAEGMLVWAKQAGGTGGDLGSDLAVDASGHSYVVGQFEGTATFGAGETQETTVTSTGANDVFVAHYDTNGMLVWASKAGGANGDLGLTLAVDALGRSYIAGQFEEAATFGSGETNETELTTTGARDIFIAQYDPEGMLVWAKQAGGPDGTRALGDLVSGLALDAGGNVYVAGQFEGAATFGLGEAQETTLSGRGASDVFVAKYGENRPTHRDEPPALPADFTVAANYPNPFNRQTRIQYGLPQAAFVRLMIYDMRGRHVQTLVEGQRSPGWHEVVFEAGTLPSGVYFYRLESGFSARRGQMLLVR